MHRFFIVILAFTLFSLNALAQRDAMYAKRVSAVVSLKSGDSISGTMKPKGEYLRQIKLKTNSGKVKVKLEDIESLKLNILRYRTISINGKLHLLEEVAYGTYSLFAYVKKSDNRSKKYFYLKVDENKSQLVLPENFLAVCEKYIFNDDYIREKIESGEWIYDDIIKVFRVYNFRQK